jgi:putative phosphoesterase
VGLVSDTHDNEPAVRAAAGFLRERRPDLVLHLGDVTTKGTLALLVGLPLVVLRGNNDPPTMGALDWSDTLAGVKVHAHHGHLKPHLQGEPDVLLHGHTHRRRAERVGRTLVVNPGALHRAPTKTIALLRLPACEVEFYEVRDEGVAPL